MPKSCANSLESTLSLSTRKSQNPKSVYIPIWPKSNKRKSLQLCCLMASNMLQQKNAHSTSITVPEQRRQTDNSCQFNGMHVRKCKRHTIIIDTSKAGISVKRQSITLNNSLSLWVAVNRSENASERLNESKQSKRLYKNATDKDSMYLFIVMPFNFHKSWHQLMFFL